MDNPLLDPGVLVTWRGAVELVPGEHVDDDAQEGAEKEQRHVGRFVPPHVVHLEVDPEGTEYPGDPQDDRRGQHEGVHLEDDTQAG
jgi:hypothetical protein